MFVLMGLSAVFPVLHGVEMYGVQDMRERIGLIWLVLQGALYILGAGLYAVRCPSTIFVLLDMGDLLIILSRLDGLNVHGLELLISGEAHIKYFMCWLSWLPGPICMDCSKPSIFTTAVLE